MKDKNEQIDLLLERNTTEQLQTVDWDRLNAAISGRLDQARQRKTPWTCRSTAFKIAAGLVAAAATVLLVVLVRTDTPTGMRFENGGRAVVEFIESKGSASIQIRPIAAKSQVSIDIGGSCREVAKCNIEIIDVKQEQQKNGRRPTWIIIRMPEPVLADNGTSRDEMDLMCLL
ncbi:MAG: hypothetical protein AMJ75_07215 [Phycisphaerae bacterium SM1_79]|nr:MAG: hypothetical protein AMJ75_07215 [Phycisphaerae bacterium SM1_79]